jgi:hypothetical protein
MCRSQLQGILAVFSMLMHVLPAIASEQTVTWETGTVDGSIGGLNSSLRIDKYGNAHVAYAGGDAEVQYSFWDHQLKRWFTTTLGRSTGFCSLVLDSKDHPHISYPDYGFPKLIHAWWDGAAWQKQVIEVPSKYIAYDTAITLDANDNPSITFYDYIGPSEDDFRRLRILTLHNGVWELKTVDRDPGSGKFNALASDSMGHPLVAYANVDPERASLRYATIGPNGKWQPEVLETAYSGSWQAVIIVVDGRDIPHIAYSDLINKVVRYATKVNGKWDIRSVDSVGKFAFPDRDGITLDEQGKPYISYYDEGKGLVKVAHQTERGWISEVVDGGLAGLNSSIQIRDGTIWLTYSAGPHGGLKFARRRLDPTGSQTRLVTAE